MNILISGDSWSVKEWGGTTEHRGLQQYFEETGCIVDNCGVGGGCNNMMILNLINTFYNNNKKYDYIFWFQTDPIRDLRPFNEFGKSIKTYEDLINISYELIDKAYYTLNKLNYKIYCLGGCSKLNLELINKYKNLIPIIPSITEFLYNDYIHPNTWMSDWIDYVDKLDQNCIDKLLEDKKRQDELFRDKYKEFFWPDGAHPNRYGHKKIYDFILETVIDRI